ncbi:MAG TPA: hypothetical protein VI959_05195 [Alphaproteobacteria bacterium]|nr:hypothetical protein [Alphaproteobacteria bacterium]
MSLILFSCVGPGSQGGKKGWLFNQNKIFQDTSATITPTNSGVTFIVSGANLQNPTRYISFGTYDVIETKNSGEFSNYVDNIAQLLSKYSNCKKLKAIRSNNSFNSSMLPSLLLD